MTRTAEGALLAILDELEPAAKTGWEAEEINLREAIDVSQAITDRRLAVTQEAQLAQQVITAQATSDANTVAIKTLDPAVADTLPPDVRTRYDPDYVTP
jgi:hypothetical protein